MTGSNSAQPAEFERVIRTILQSGRAVFAFAIMALGVETLVCAQSIEASPQFFPRYRVIPVIPWVPAIPWLAYLLGAILILCAAGLLSARTRKVSALTLGALLFFCTIVLEVPKNAVALSSMSLRTGVFEPLALATIAWLLPGPGAIPAWLDRASRYLLALSFIVFGVDHLIALVPIASLIPAWIPSHVFWIAFFGVAFIAAAASIALNILQRWGAAGIGLMFAIWVFTLHLPRVLGLYGIPGAPHNPNEWSSLLIAVALWGGPWGLASNVTSRS